MTSVLITGASSGIGESTAYRFARQGAALYLAARRGERLKEVAEECLRRGAAEARWGEHDLEVPDEGARAVREALKQLGKLDVLVLNAGFGIYGPLQEVPPEWMRRLWQVNFQSGYESIHAALPHFLERGSGHIVLVSSVLGRVGVPIATAYAASKFAQVGLGEALWSELRGTGVGVTVVCPSYTMTEFFDAATRTQGASQFRRIGGNTAEEVADALFKAVSRKRRRIIPSSYGRLLDFFCRVLPDTAAHLVAWSVNRSRKRN